MNRVHWLAILLMAMLPLLAHAQVYKWKDKDGAVQYSDLPPPNNIPYEAVDKIKVTPKSATPETAKGGDSQAVRNAAALRRQSDAEQEKRSDERKRNEQQQKQEQCQNAKANYQNFKQGGRIYKMTPEGERHYLGDEDLQKGLEAATKELQEFCTD
ncbi:DUF4124 domain-containing protein [Methylobacillus gramineus]|uniref:DUF4124 domain-containing protein n=1 Tax=Methylobacillus gramineus TaxID=755169 RepID=UPI001CFF952B|nr:DUF4124 domain-containing protein [Methylobacillus gramineus]MCB5183996.1 DUF4124 domain-containing protein [Methylobacillus gramineus]